MLFNMVNDVRKDNFLKDMITQVMRSYGPKSFTALDWWPPDAMASEHFGGLSTSTMDRYLVSIPTADANGRARASHLKKKGVEIEWFECDPDLGEKLLNLPADSVDVALLQSGDRAASMGQKGHSRVFVETARVLRPKCPFIVVREKYEALPGSATDFFEESRADRSTDSDLGLVGSVFFKRMDRTPQQRKVRRRAAPRAKKSSRKRPSAPPPDDDKISLDDLSDALF